MKKKKAAGILISVFCFCICVICVRAVSSPNVINHFETGIVKITVDMHEDGTETGALLPAAKIKQSPSIYNNGADCYVRAKVSFRGLDEITEAEIYGISKDWKRAGDGYWYYTGILKNKEEIPFFEGFEVPEELPQEKENEVFWLDIRIDAIQSRNFTPMFDLVSPWGAVELLACETDGNVELNTFIPAGSGAFQIAYQGDSSVVIENAETFFKDLPYLMPGDTYKESVKIKNNRDQELKLYFQSEALSELELLEKIQFQITSLIDGVETSIYTGDLKADALSEAKILGSIENGKEAEIRFEIKVPVELNNQYHFTSSSVKWTFSTEPIKPIEQEEEKGSVLTGDSKWHGIVASTVFCGLSLAVIVGCRKKKRGSYE